MSAILGVLSLSGCASTNHSSSEDMVPGFYKNKSNETTEWNYLDIDADEFRVYKAQKPAKGAAVVSKDSVISLPVQSASSLSSYVKLTKSHVDWDFLTILLKVRPEQAGVPIQLNTDLNGVLYLGYQTDYFTIRYTEDPLGISRRSIRHISLSFGFFSGLGNTFISPTTTNNLIGDEYDGFVWLKGIAGIIDVNGLSLGLTFGFDNLFSHDREIWIYEGKPWIGLGFGLHLN